MQTQFHNFRHEPSWGLILLKNGKKFTPNIITSLCSESVIVTSLETTLSGTASGKNTTGYSDFRYSV